MSMKNRGVSFNLDDPAQKELHDYTLNFTNFSAYVKGLIERERSSRNNVKKIKSEGGSISFKVD